MLAIFYINIHSSYQLYWWTTFTTWRWLAQYLIEIPFMFQPYQMCAYRVDRISYFVSLKRTSNPRTKFSLYIGSNYVWWLIVENNYTYLRSYVPTYLQTLSYTTSYSSHIQVITLSSYIELKVDTWRKQLPSYMYMPPLLNKVKSLAGPTWLRHYHQVHNAARAPVNFLSPGRSCHTKDPLAVSKYVACISTSYVI